MAFLTGFSDRMRAFAPRASNAVTAALPQNCHCKLCSLQFGAFHFGRNLKNSAHLATIPFIGGTLRDFAITGEAMLTLVDDRNRKWE